MAKLLYDIGSYVEILPNKKYYITNGGQQGIIKTLEYLQENQWILERR